MACIIRGSNEGKFIATVVEFSGDTTALEKFFATTPAHSYTPVEASWVSGTFISPDVMPTRLKITKGKRLHDWRIVRGGATLVSSRFKDIIEAIEPDKHQFFAVTVEFKDGELFDGQYFIFNVVGSIESIIEDESNLTPLGKGIIDDWMLQPAGEWRCAVNINVIGERACWTERRYPARWFVADRVARELTSQKLLGFGLSDHCVEIAR